MGNNHANQQTGTTDPKKVTPTAPATTKTETKNNLDAAKQAQLLRSLANITKEWKTICGSLLTDVDPPEHPPDKNTFQKDAYQLLARRDGFGKAGLSDVYLVLQLTTSRQDYFQLLEIVERDVKQDGTRRDAIHDCLEDLAGGGEVQYNSDRILAHYGMLSKNGRLWWQGGDAKEWTGAYSTYLANDAMVMAHAIYGKWGAAMWGGEEAIRLRDARRAPLTPLLNLLVNGALIGKKVDDAADGKTAAAGKDKAQDEAEQKKWKTEADALKSEITPYLPPDGAVGADAKADKKLDYHEKNKLIAKIAAASKEVRDLLYQDTVFMRRVAMLGEQVDTGVGGTPMPSLFRALDPIEHLYDDLRGMKTDEQGHARQGQLPTPAQKFQMAQDFMVGHPGKEGQPTRMRVMTHAQIRNIIIYLPDAQQRDLWKLATRGTLDPTIEDQLYAAVKAGNADAAARALLAMGNEDHQRMRDLQDDVLFRNAIYSDAMRKQVDIDGVKVRPYDLCLLMWGQRPGSTADPGQTGAVEDNPSIDDRPLNVTERRKLDRELYDPTIDSLKDDLSAADSWFFAGARTSDSDVANHLRKFAKKCADGEFVPLIRRAGTPPGRELATRYNARTGHSMHSLIKSGCGDEARREAERVLNITIDAAAVGTVGGTVGRAGDRPENSDLGLEQALRETMTKDGSRTISQAVHDKAKSLKEELNEGGVFNWNGADVDDCKRIWNELKILVTDDKLQEVRNATKRPVHLIELLQNAYQEIDGPLVKAMHSGLSESEQKEVLPYYGLDAAAIASREAEAKKAAGPEDAKAVGREQAAQVFGAKAEHLFGAIAGLVRSSPRSQFEEARKEMALYLGLRTGSPAASGQGRTSGETPADLDPGAGVPVPDLPEDFYRLNYGLTPRAHCAMLARTFAIQPAERAEGDPGYKAEDVADMLGIDRGLVSGPAKAPPDNQKPIVDDRNRHLVRPGFTEQNAWDNAKDMWRLLHSGGEIHLIQTMLYGPYNDEEQRLIRLAFRQLSGGIDWQFYLRQAQWNAAHPIHVANEDSDDDDKKKKAKDAKAAEEARRWAIGGGGTGAGQEVSKGSTIKVTADRGELDSALAVATLGELDIRTELRNAISHNNVNDIFRIADRADDGQCRTILADQKLMGQLHHALDSYAWDRVYRVLTGQDDLGVRLESRSHGDYSSTWERIFGGTDEEGMKEDIKEYVHRLRVKIEDDERREARKGQAPPSPELMQINVTRKLREACRQLAAHPEYNYILEDELSGTDLATTRGLLVGGGAESNVAALSGGGDADAILAEIRRMPGAERRRRLNDPEYMQRLTKQLYKGSDMQMALTLLQSPGEGPPVATGEGAKTEADSSGGGEGKDALAEVARLAAPRGVHDADDLLAQLVALSPADHQRLIDNPALIVQVMAVFRYASKQKREIAERVIGHRKEQADDTLGQGIVYPDAKPGTCEGRTISEEEKQRLAYLQLNAVVRLQQASTRSYDILLAQAVEIYKMDFRPHSIIGGTPATLPNQSKAEDPAKPKADPNADMVDKIDADLRGAVWDKAKGSLGDFSKDERETVRKGVVHDMDPSAARVRNAWGVIHDNSEAVTETLKQASDEQLIDFWTTVNMQTVSGGESLATVYKHYRDAYDAAGGFKQVSSKEQDELNAKKLDYMNYVIDISSWFEADLLPHAGGWFDDSKLTDPGAKRSRIKQRDNKEYNEWRAIIRSRIPKLPKAKVAAKIGASDRPDDAALIDNPNRQFQTAREFREDEYLRKFGTVGAGARVAMSERAVVNDAMARYGREAAVAETNEEGGWGVVTAGEGAKVERTGAEVDRAMREFSAARAKIASMAALIVSVVVGAAVTVLTGGAGAGLAWMLVAGAISGAAGAAAGALTREAIQGEEFDMSHEGMEQIAEGAISGMIFAGTTRMASNIMKGLAGPASLKAQAEAMERLMTGAKPTVWETLLSGAKGAAHTATEMAIAEGLNAAIEAGLVPLNPAIWVDGWNEGVIRARHKIREQLSHLGERELSAAIMGALTHGAGSLLRDRKPVKITPDDKNAIYAMFGKRMGKNLERYMDVKEVMIMTFASWVTGKLVAGIEGKPIDWSNIPEELFNEWFNAWKGLSPMIHADSRRIGQERAHQVKEELNKHPELTRAEVEHYKSLNPELDIGEIITVDQYLSARQGMFEARVSQWEAELGHLLTPGQRQAFQDYVRKNAKDSADYQKLLNTNPLTLEEVKRAKFEHEERPEEKREETTEKPVDKPSDKPSDKPTSTATDTNTDKPGDKTTTTTTGDGKVEPPKTADDFAKITGSAESIEGSTFTGKARSKAEPGKIQAEVIRALPLVAGQFGGAVEVLGANLLRVKAGSESFVVRIATMPAEGGEVARYRFTGHDTAIIEVSERARDKHVERAIADLVAEMKAVREAQLEGKELPKESALKPGSTRNELSAADLGKIAQLKALLRQLAQAQNPGEGVKPNSVVIKQLKADVDALLAHLGLIGEAGQKRLEEVVEPHLSPSERNTLAIRIDEPRRTEVDSSLPEHSGVEVHNHFLGIVKPETFADRAAAAEARRKGVKVSELGRSSWEIMLDRIASMDQYAHKKADGTVAKRGEEFAKRGVSGDAVSLAKETALVLSNPRTPVDSATHPDWLVQGARELRSLNDALKIATDTGNVAEFSRLSGEIAKKKAQLAELACKTALTATDDTDFNSAYEIRDQLIKDTFGNPATGTSGYEDFARVTVRELIRDGLIYNEQSNSLKKLNEKFTKALMDKVIWDVAADMVKKGEITEQQALQLRNLTMILTGFFGPEETRADELKNETPDEKKKREESFDDISWHGGTRENGQKVEGALEQLRKQLLERSDIVGIDIAGPETARFDAAGKKRFQELYMMLLEVSAKRGRPVTLRPHVGEGFTDTHTNKEFNKHEGKKNEGESSHYDRARSNLELMLDAIEGLGKHYDPTKVPVRFGHSTHATPEVAARMAKLGIIAEVNLKSNVATAAIDQTNKTTGKPSETELYDDHSLLTLLFYGVQTILSTDAHSVMGTDMAAEYGRARDIIDDFLHGKMTVRVDPKVAKGRGKEIVLGKGTPTEVKVVELSKGDLSGEELKRFTQAYEKLHKDATDFRDDMAKADKKDRLMWQDLVKLLEDPESATDPGKRLHKRDLLRRLALDQGVIDETSLQASGVDPGKFDLVRKASRDLLQESEAQRGVERWQSHGIETDAPQMFEDAQFKLWYEKWIQQTDRVFKGEDGHWHAKYPPDMPEQYKKSIDAIVKKGNVTLMHQAAGTATELVDKFPELATMDPKSPEYQARRADLIARFGKKSVEKFEESLTARKGDKARAELDARVGLIVDEGVLATLKAKFEGCEVFITGSATQGSKDLSQVKDLDLIVMAPADMPYEKRIELEKAVAGLKVPTSEYFREKYGKKELEVDAKVLTPRESFGLMNAKLGTNPETGKPRTPMEFLRIDGGGDKSNEGPKTDPTSGDKDDAWKDAAKSDKALADLGGEATTGKVDAAARDQLVADIRRQVPDLALTQAVMDGASVVVNLIMPGGGLTGIKTMNDQLVGYRINSEKILPARDALIQQVFGHFGLNLVEQSYKTATLASSLTIEQLQPVMQAAMHQIDAGMRPILRTALQEGITFWQEQAHKAKEGSDERAEADKRLKKMRETVAKITDDFVFDFQFGLAKIESGGQGDAYQRALDAKMNATRAALMGRDHGNGLSGTELGNAGDPRGGVYDEKAFVNFCKEGEAIKDGIIAGGNLITVKHGDQTHSMMLFTGDGSPNRDVMRDVRKGKISDDMLGNANERALLAQFKRYFDHINAFDYFKSFTRGENDEAGQRVAKALEMVKKLQEGKSVEPTEVKKLTTENLAGEVNPQAGETSEMEFYNKSAHLHDRLLINADIKDLGLDLMEGYAKAEERVADGADVKRTGLAASDNLLRFKRNAVDQMRQFYGEVLDRAIADAKKNHNAGLAKALEGEREPLFLLGGDEITLSLHHGLQPYVGEIAAKLAQAARARVAVTDTGHGSNAVEAHKKALQAADPAHGILKEYETAERELRSLVSEIGDRKVAERGAALVDGLGLNRLFIDATTGKNKLVNFETGKEVDNGALKKRIGEVTAQLVDLRKGK